MRTCGSRWRLFVDLLAQVEVPLRVRVREPRTVAVYWTAMLVVLGFGGGANAGYLRHCCLCFAHNSYVPSPEPTSSRL